jgi:prepilin-type N-terminal cleavage/methylation domain-containing protein
MQTNGSRGFTLIELLTVIAIIGILASLLIVGVNAALRKSRQTKAAAEVRQVASAWEWYYREYNVWPSGVGGTEGGAPDNISNGSNILAGANAPAGVNPRGIVFMEFESGRGGMDPWKREYRFMLDQDYNGAVVMMGGNRIARPAIAWSAGEDGVDYTADDLCSWK